MEVVAEAQFERHSIVTTSPPLGRLTAALVAVAMLMVACSDQPESSATRRQEAGSESAGGDSAATGGDAGPQGSQGTSTGGGSEPGATSGSGSGAGGATGTGSTAGGGGSTAPSQPVRPPGWRVMGKAPIKGRHSHSAVWTGKEMIVWGGAGRAGNAPIYLEDGAAYDPATDKWRKLPASPLGPRADHFAAWTGTEMLVWGGNPGVSTPFGNNEFRDGAAYNPATDKWRPMADFPLPARYAARAVWTGEQLVVWGGSRAEEGEDPPPRADGAAYDPGRDRWSVMADSPLAGRLSPLAAAVDGDVLISWGFNRDPGQSTDGARYDPDAQIWTAVAPAPSTETAWCFDLAGCVGIQAGSRIVFAGEGLVYDSGVDRWAPVAKSPFADPFLDGKALAWTGSRVLLWGGGRYPSDAEAPPTDVPGEPAGMAYDPAADRWSPLPPAPIAPRARTRGVWTGAEFLIWGGEAADEVRVQHADGAAWTP